MMHEWKYDHNRDIDVICMGRVAVDLYSEEIGKSLEETETFRKYIGGCAGNIAIGSSRLGLRSAMFSCVGTDAMGQFVRQQLQKESVNLTMLKETSRHLTGLVLLGVNPPDRFPLIFYRENCADMQLKTEDVNINFIQQAKTLLITGTGLSTPAMRETTHYAVEAAKSVGTRVIFDLDYRPVLWGLTSLGEGEIRYKVSHEVSLHYQQMLPKCDLVVGTEEEILVAGDSSTSADALQSIRSKTIAPIVVKRGAHGAGIYIENLHQPITSRAFPVTVLNVLGAGDGFISGFMRGLLRGKDWQTCVTFGNACGAIVVTRHGCAPAMPYFPEMTRFILDNDDTANSEGQSHVRVSYS